MVRDRTRSAKKQFKSFALNNPFQNPPLAGVPPGVDFINIFMHSFYARSSPSVRTQSNCQYLFFAFGIYMCKSCELIVMKLTPGVDFTQHFMNSFLGVQIPKLKVQNDTGDLTVIFAYGICVLKSCV